MGLDPRNTPPGGASFLRNTRTDQKSSTKRAHNPSTGCGIEISGDDDTSGCHRSLPATTLYRGDTPSDDGSTAYSCREQRSPQYFLQSLLATTVTISEPQASTTTGPEVRRWRLYDPHAGEGISRKRSRAESFRPKPGSNLARSQKIGVSIIDRNAPMTRWFLELPPRLLSSLDVRLFRGGPQTERQGAWPF